MDAPNAECRRLVADHLRALAGRFLREDHLDPNRPVIWIGFPTGADAKALEACDRSGHVQRQVAEFSRNLEPVEVRLTVGGDGSLQFRMGEGRWLDRYRSH